MSLVFVSVCLSVCVSVCVCCLMSSSPLSVALLATGNSDHLPSWPPLSPQIPGMSNACDTCVCARVCVCVCLCVRSVVIASVLCTACSTPLVCYVLACVTYVLYVHTYTDGVKLGGGAGTALLYCGEADCMVSHRTC